MHSTTGVECITKDVSSRVPPSSFHTIRLSCVPQSGGQLVIRGCRVKVAGCTERDFIIPIATNSTVPALSPALQQRVKPGKNSLEPQTLFNQVNQRDQESEAFLLAEVVPAQPTLHLRNTNLKHESLVLYDGQRYLSFRVRS